jgi:hypothetical protein
MEADAFMSHTPEAISHQKGPPRRIGDGSQETAAGILRCWSID